MGTAEVEIVLRGVTSACGRRGWVVDILTYDCMSGVFTGRMKNNVAGVGNYSQRRAIASYGHFHFTCGIFCPEWKQTR
jgi:hypothetical protein